ncbi:SWIM zinc finger family protein [Saccharolobus islandicus]|uniref:Zinc finger SWIM domain protein n=1 Tax=Saccharolobus islandicus (strain M.16.4 / Kamchatka \|nr:SWIM zinc finger family protein [Sulfolobus islandicus]ACR42235.1 zinc finger SWIM domain protein [Sulfolobus islandicus M.16.4]
MISTQIPKSYVKRTSVFYTLGEGIVVSADIQSKSRANLTHYTRIIVDPLSLKVVKSSCDCGGFTFRGKCWHIEALKQLASTELREEVEKIRQEMMQIEEDIASWGRMI